MITINKYPEQRVNLFSPEGLIGEVNELELLDARCQICENKLTGYYVMFNDEKIDIQPSGILEVWPHGFFDESDFLHSKFFRLQRSLK